MVGHKYDTSHNFDLESTLPHTIQYGYTDSISKNSAQVASEFYGLAISEKPIGAGAQAEVYLVAHKTPEGFKKMAMRTMKDRDEHIYKGNEKEVIRFCERLVHEAEIAQTIKGFGGNVVGVYATALLMDEIGPHPVQFSEYVAGGTLEAALNVCHQGFSSDNTRDKIIDLLEIASIAEERGIVHLDIKPTNILLDEVGDVVLGDFGAAHVLGSEFKPAHGTRIGTPSYMCPHYYDTGDAGRADIFSIGTVAYEMLTGDLPFPSQESITQLFASIKTNANNGDFKRTEIEEWDEWLKYSLAGRIQDRFRSAASAKKRLEELLGPRGKSFENQHSMTNDTQVPIFPLVTERKAEYLLPSKERKVPPTVLVYRSDRGKESRKQAL